MHFWLSRGRALNQITKKCYCQEIVCFPHNNNIFQRNKSSLQNANCIAGRTLVNNITVIRCSPMLTKMSALPSMELNYSTTSEKKGSQEEPSLTTKDKLKRAVKDYGATVIIFHVTISLTSLGISYLLVSSGVDVGSLLEKFGVSTNQFTTGASTFVVAYALHKVFAPVRISITLGCTPFIVRYLRRIGILKTPKSTNS